MTGSVLGVWVSSANKIKKKTLRTFILQGRLTIIIITENYRFCPDVISALG